MKLVRGQKESNDILQAKLNEVSDQVKETSQVKGSFADRIIEIAQEEVQEARFVIFNIKEPDYETVGDPDLGSHADDRIVDQLIHTVLGANDVDIVSTSRVPKFKRRGDTYNQKLEVKLGSVKNTKFSELLRHCVIMLIGRNAGCVYKP